MFNQSSVHFLNIITVRMFRSSDCDFKRTILLLIIWPVRPRTQFRWKTMWKNSPICAPHASSDRAGKTRTTLLEKYARNEANAAMKAFSLRQKN